MQGKNDEGWSWGFFDPEYELSIVERRLPHWSQAGTMSFITFRTNDSMPRYVVQNWHDERIAWLKQRGVPIGRSCGQLVDVNLRAVVQELDSKTQIEFFNHFSRMWQDELDACHGECPLKRPECARVVAECLEYHDGESYQLSDFVVMPNHVHLLAAFLDEAEMLRQCESWKRYTARRINRILGRTGRFWRQDSFDHLIRSENQFEYRRSYIAGNPKSAGLVAGEYLYRRKELQNRSEVKSSSDEPNVKRL